MIVLDTNALIWWISDPGKLSKKARKTIENAKQEGTIYISSISVLEIYVLVKKERLKLNTLPDKWLEEIENLPFINFVPVNNKIAIASVELPDFPHQDPADRIIIATALNMAAELITSDKKILNYPHVESIW